MDFGSYGKTWWANKWLSSILATASEQAVLQGLKFAARGQVTSIDIVDNRVISVVKGPNGGLHNNYIVFPKFSKESSEIFVSFLKQQPAELLALNNKALSPSLELLMSKSGLQLFDDPAKVNMGCDCRDERPCKYLVATFLKIAEQAIHGLDLEFIKDYKPDAMEMEAPSETNLVRSFSKATRLVGTSAENASAIGTAAGDSDEHEAQNAAELSHAEDASASLFGGYKGSGRESQNSIPPKQLPTFDFKSWKDYSHILPAMLQNFPKFCPAGNFRKSFTDELESCHKFFTDFENFDAFSEQFRVNNAKTFLMENEQLRLFHKPGWHWNFEQSMADKVINSNLTVTNVMGALCCLSAGNFSWHHRALLALDVASGFLPCAHRSDLSASFLDRERRSADALAPRRNAPRDSIHCRRPRSHRPARTRVDKQRRILLRNRGTRRAHSFAVHLAALEICTQIQDAAQDESRQFALVLFR